MTNLVDTIRDALARLGPAAEAQLRDLLAELGGLNLGDEDRLSVLATALAAVAALHHGRHKPVYLEAVRTWSLEISVGLSPAPVRLSASAGDPSIEDGAEALIGGLDMLLDGMVASGVRLQDRLVLELALFSQLLGQHDAHTIHRTLIAVIDAVGGEEYRPGQAVRVPLSDMLVPLARDACLASLAPRGVA